MARKNWGKRSMKEYMGKDYNANDRFVTYEEMTRIYNESAEKQITRNTMCHWYHKAMLKLATSICKQQGYSLSDDEIKRMSRSIEFQTFVRDIMES